MSRAESKMSRVEGKMSRVTCKILRVEGKIGTLRSATSTSTTICKLIVNKLFLFYWAFSPRPILRLKTSARGVKKPVL